MLVLDATPGSSGNIFSPTTVSGPPTGSTVPISPNAAHTFPSDQIEFVLQQINDQLGQSFSFGTGYPYYANNWELSEGTAAVGASFAGPMVKLSKYEDIENFGNNPGQCPASVYGKCNAVLSIGVQSNALDLMETQGIYLEANSVAPQSRCPDCNVSAMQIKVESNDPNHEQGWLPAVGEIQVEDNSNYVLSGLKGLEFDMGNNSHVECPDPGAGAAGICDGVILAKSVGIDDVTYAFHVRGGSTNSFLNGFYCDAYVSGPTGQASSVLQSCYDDESIATNGIIEAGTHANGILVDGTNTTAINITGTNTAAINLAAGAGPIALNGNNLFVGAINPTTGGYIGSAAPFAVSLYGGNGSSSQEILRAAYGQLVLENGQFITQAAPSAPQITAAGDTTTGFYQSSSGTWQYESGGTNIAALSSSGLRIESGDIVSPIMNLTGSPPSVSSGVSYGGVTLSSTTSCGTLFGSAGCLEIRVGSTVRHIPFF